MIKSPLFAGGLVGLGLGIPKGPTPNRYSPHYTGKRGIAAERNRRKIESGQIPRSQVLRGRKAA